MALVITGAGGCTVTRSTAEPVPPALDALMVTPVVPVAVVVPLMMPLVVLTTRPGGRGVALKLVGLLEAVIV